MDHPVMLILAVVIVLTVLVPLGMTYEKHRIDAQWERCTAHCPRGVSEVSAQQCVCQPARCEP